MSDKELKVRVSVDGKQGRDDLKKTEKAFNQTTQSAKQAAFAMRQVPAQFTDIVVSLQGGQNPMQVLLQQGGQLKDLFGGAGNAVKALTGYVVSLLTPLNLVLAATAGIAAAFVAGQAQSDRLRQNVIATGGAAGISADQIEGMVQRIGEVSGSYGNAREAAEALVATGQIAGQDLEKAMMGVAAGVKLTGRDVQDLTEDFVAIGEDPVKAAGELNKKYNFLTVAVYDQIKALKEQGRTQEAASLLSNQYADTLANRTNEMVENLGYVQRAWNGVTEAASEALNAILSLGRERGKAEEMADILRRLSTPGSLGVGYQNGRLVDTRQMLQARYDALQKEMALAAKTQAQDKLRKQKDGAAIVARDAFDKFVAGNAVGTERLAIDQRKVLTDWQDAAKAYAVGSEEYIKAVRVRDAKLKALQDEFNDKGKRTKTPKVKGLTNPVTVGFSVGADELANIKQSLEAATAQVSDSLNFAGEMYEQAYRDNTITLKAFYDNRLAIIEAASQQETNAQKAFIKALEDERKAVQAAPTKTQQDTERQRNRLADIDKQIASTNAKIAETDRERAQSVARIAAERARETQALKDSLAELALQNKLDSGTATAQDMADAVRRKYADALAKVADSPEAIALYERRIEIEINQASMQKAEQDFNAAMQRMNDAEQSIHIQQEAGLMTEQVARERIIALHKQTAAELEKIIPLLEKSANAIGPDAVAKVANFRNEILRLSTSVSAIKTQIEGVFKNSITGVFNDIASGASSAQEVVLKFFASVAQGLANIAAQEAATAIVKEVSGSAFGSSISSWLGSFFHTGGVVGQQGGTKKAVPSFVFKDAPRYHSGGIAGLKPNEVPAILMGGPKGTREEVLTANDPRHSDNLSSNQPGGSPVVQNTNIIAIDPRDIQNAAFGSGAQQKLINMINLNPSAFRTALRV